MKLIFTDQYANILFLINGLAIILYMGAKKKKQQRAMKFGNYETLQKVAGRNFLKTGNVILITRLLALTLLIIGISSPVILQEVSTSKSDYVIAIDSSSSMLTGDMDPNRFEASKDISKDLVSQLGNKTRVGVVSYSGQANKEQEMTDDKNLVIQSIDETRIGEQAGTATGEALSMSVSMLAGNQRGKRIILITDGKNNVGIPLSDAVDMAIAQNVSVHAVGIGEENQSVERFQNIDGQNATQARYPNLNVTRLEGIANRTGGKFVTVSERDDLQSALIDLETEERRFSISNYFIFAAAIMLLIEWVIGNTKLSVIP